MNVAEIREDEIYTEVNVASSSSLPNAVYTQNSATFHWVLAGEMEAYEIVLNIANYPPPNEKHFPISWSL
jgi:acetyl-CoA carboxylase carboxyltransferase component